MKKIIFCIIIMVVMLASGCGRDTKPLHVGSKDFTEQHILGEIIAKMAETAGVPVERSIPYGDGFVTLEGIKSGSLDIYPEYNGTGLGHLGQPAIADGTKALTKVRKLYKPLGLEWLDRLGFANNYEIVMKSDRAAALEIRTISDLANLPGGVRFVARKGWVERPSDGLSALLRRFGLRKGGVSEFNNAEQVYHSLLTNSADVAIGFSTDGQIADYGLVILKDDKAFFPVYEPSFLVRADTLKRFPQLKPALEKLSGKISTSDMQEMNKQVDMEGQSPAVAANTFLVKAGLVSKDEVVTLSSTKELVLAVGIDDELGGLAGKSIRAIRKAFPKRRVVMQRTSNPISLVNEGVARIGFAGTESFFSLQGEGLPELNQTVEGVAAVGHRYVHILTAVDNNIDDVTQITKMGVGHEGGTSHHIANILVSGFGIENQVKMETGEIVDQIAQLRNQQLDAVVFMASLGHEKLLMEFSKGGLKLVPMDTWKEGNAVMRFPFLKLATIAKNTYKGQKRPVETVSSQAVLIGPAPKSMADSGGSGPMGGVVGNQPITDEVVLELNNSLTIEEKIDPTVLSAAVLKPRKEMTPKGIKTDYAASTANFFVLAAVIYLVYLFVMDDPKKRKKS